MECLICYDDISDDYAIISNEFEKGIYHTHCLERWLFEGSRGILSREKPKSYIVIKNGQSNEVLTEDITIVKKQSNINTAKLISLAFLVMAPVFILIGLTIWIIVNH